MFYFCEIAPRALWIDYCVRIFEDFGGQHHIQRAALLLVQNRYGSHDMRAHGRGVSDAAPNNQSHA